MVILVCCVQHLPLPSSPNWESFSPILLPLCDIHSLYRHTGVLHLRGSTVDCNCVTQGEYCVAVPDLPRKKRTRYSFLFMFASQTNAFSLRTCAWIFMICLSMMYLPRGTRIVKLVNQKMSLFFLATHLSRWQMIIFYGLFLYYM